MIITVWQVSTSVNHNAYRNWKRSFSILVVLDNLSVHASSVEGTGHISWMIEHPPCHVLTICPLSSCGASKGMRMFNNHKTNTFVKCEECNAVFCELCLKRIYKNKLGFDHREECDETKAIKLVRRYQRASPEIQAKCRDKLKWIKEYASSREMDASASLWVKEFASICPNCKNAIERSDGCFHMHCVCGTHYCYECGEEIFYPFYGTHHCWEREIDEMQFDLFG